MAPIKILVKAFLIFVIFAGYRAISIGGTTQKSHSKIHRSDLDHLAIAPYIQNSSSGGVVAWPFYPDVTSQEIIVKNNQSGTVYAKFKAPGNTTNMYTKLDPGHYRIDIKYTFPDNTTLKLDATFTHEGDARASFTPHCLGGTLSWPAKGNVVKIEYSIQDQSGQFIKDRFDRHIYSLPGHQLSVDLLLAAGNYVAIVTYVHADNRKSFAEVYFRYGKDRCFKNYYSTVKNGLRLNFKCELDQKGSQCTQKITLIFGENPRSEYVYNNEEKCFDHILRFYPGYTQTDLLEPNKKCHEMNKTIEVRAIEEIEQKFSPIR